MAAIHTIAIVFFLVVGGYFGFDQWQERVQIYASSCETPSGQSLPIWVCREIVNYRYIKDNW
jgi:hypothetical protein